MNKQLIINADDFGYDADADAAIMELAKIKAISSTTVLANMVNSEKLKDLAKTGIGIGLHLNLTEGQPVCLPYSVYSIIDEKGNFKSWMKLFFGFIFGTVVKKHLELEIQAQINFLKSNKINISHADSHKHIHQLPFMGLYITKVLKQMGISKIRNCSPSHIKSIRMIIVWIFSRLTKSRLTGFKQPEKLFSYFSVYSKGDFSGFISSLQRTFVSHQCIEIMTHPGIKNKEGRYLNRQAEYLFLKAHYYEIPSDISIINYHGLHD